MNYYLDTEFCEGSQKKRIFGIPYGNTKPTIDLISIGIVSEDGRVYYAISKDFNLKESWNRWQQRTGQGDRNNREPREYWLRENVLKKIHVDLLKLESQYLAKQRRIMGYTPPLNTEFTYSNFKYLVSSHGKTNKQIADEIKEFVKPQPTGNILNSNPPQIEYDNSPIQFYAHYCSYDWVVFCWIFGKMIELPKGFPMYCHDLKVIMEHKLKTVHIDDGQGNDLKTGRLDWIKTLPHYPVNKNPHNALSDAKFDKDLHKFLKQL